MFGVIKQLLCLQPPPEASEMMLMITQSTDYQSAAKAISFVTILKDLTGKDLVDRLPVIVSELETNQLLGVPKLISGTGEAQATAANQLLEDWGGYNI